MRIRADCRAVSSGSPPSKIKVNSCVAKSAASAVRASETSPLLASIPNKPSASSNNVKRRVPRCSNKCQMRAFTAVAGTTVAPSVACAAKNKFENGSPSIVSGCEAKVTVYDAVCPSASSARKVIIINCSSRVKIESKASSKVTTAGEPPPVAKPVTVMPKICGKMPPTEIVRTPSPTTESKLTVKRSSVGAAKTGLGAAAANAAVIVSR